MGFRFRKSIKLGKEVRLNMSKRGLGMSFSIPGTGISYSTNSGKRRKSKSNHKSTRKTTYKVTSETQPKKPLRKGLTPFLLTLFLGWLGVHWFYSGRIAMGFLYLCTGGLVGFGWLYDTIRQAIALYQMIKADKNQLSE